jgi:hypothetical protein
MQRLTLRHGDCVEVLKGYGDGSIGAVVCDPPYDLTAVSRGGWHSKRVGVTAPASDSAHQWQGWGTALKPSWEPAVVGRKPE